MRKLTERNLEIINVYKKLKSYTDTGKKFGISRQAIEQIVSKAILLIQDAELIRIKRKDYSRDKCLICKRPFINGLKRARKTGFCYLCNSYERKKAKGLKGSSRRYFLLPPNCKNCDTPFIVGNKSSSARRASKEDLCQRCYTKTPKAVEQRKKYYKEYRKRPAVKEKQRAYIKKWKARQLENKSKFL